MASRALIYDQGSAFRVFRGLAVKVWACLKDHATSSGVYMGFVKGSRRVTRILSCSSYTRALVLNVLYKV